MANCIIIRHTLRLVEVTERIEDGKVVKSATKTHSSEVLKEDKFFSRSFTRLVGYRDED